MKAVIPAVWSAALHPPHIPGTKSPETKHVLNQIQAQLTCWERAAPDLLTSFCHPFVSPWVAEMLNQKEKMEQEETNQNW